MTSPDGFSCLPIFPRSPAAPCLALGLPPVFAKRVSGWKEFSYSFGTPHGAPTNPSRATTEPRSVLLVEMVCFEPFDTGYVSRLMRNKLNQAAQCAGAGSGSFRGCLLVEDGRFVCNPTWRGPFLAADHEAYFSPYVWLAVNDPPLGISPSKYSNSTCLIWNLTG